VDNAVRYTPAGGTVTVELGADAEGARLAVCDTGPGIKPEDLEHIFEPFYRGQAQKNIPGTGLGLPIVKRIAERHGGRVEVETAPGRGSAFRVLLPRTGRREDGHRQQVPETCMEPR
jgi:signal transduction histidine kinase